MTPILTHHAEVTHALLPGWHATLQAIAARDTPRPDHSPGHRPGRLPALSAPRYSAWLVGAGNAAMTPETLAALRGSIAKWQHIVAGTDTERPGRTGLPHLPAAPGRWCLVGEWFGREYKDYIAERLTKMEKPKC